MVQKKGRSFFIQNAEKTEQRTNCIQNENTDGKKEAVIKRADARHGSSGTDCIQNAEKTETAAAK